MISVVLCVIVALAYILWRWKNHNDPNVPPQHPGSLPIIGNAHQFLGDGIKLWQFLNKLSDFSLKCGGISTVYLGPLYRVYFITDPDDCLTLSNACFDKPFVYDLVKEWANCGLVSADVSTWKPHRKLLNPMFSQQMLNENLEIFNSQARRLVKQMSVELGKDKFDSHKYIICNSKETVCQIAFGLKGKNVESMFSDYSQATQDMLEVFIAKTQKLWLHVPFIYNRSTYKMTLDKSIRIATDVTNKIIQQRKAELKNAKLCENNINEPESFLDIMLKLAETKDAFTDVEIKEHLDTIFFAGFDTSAETLTFALKLIGSNERVQQRIYEELHEVLGDKTVDVGRYDLPKLVYLEAVIKETLRICPTVPLAARSILQDVTLKKYTLRAGSIGVICAIGVHKHPLWGPDVEEFRPERWLEPTLPNNPSLFAAFSLGKRNCIGKWYAMISLKTTLAHILRNYRIRADESKMKIKFDISIRSVCGHEISIEHRK